MINLARTLLARTKWALLVIPTLALLMALVLLPGGEPGQLSARAAPAGSSGNAAPDHGALASRTCGVATIPCGERDAPADPTPTAPPEPTNTPPAPRPRSTPARRSLPPPHLRQRVPPPRPTPAHPSRRPPRQRRNSAYLRAARSRFMAPPARGSVRRSPSRSSPTLPRTSRSRDSRPRCSSLATRNGAPNATTTWTMMATVE